MLICSITLQAQIKSTNIQGYLCFNKKDGFAVYQVYKKYPLLVEKNNQLKLTIEDKNLIIENLKAKDKKTTKRIIKNSVIAFFIGVASYFFIDTIKDNN